MFGGFTHANIQAVEYILCSAPTTHRITQSDTYDGAEYSFPQLAFHNSSTSLGLGTSADNEVGHERYNLVDTLLSHLLHLSELLVGVTLDDGILRLGAPQLLGAELLELVVLFLAEVSDIALGISLGLLHLLLLASLCVGNSLVAALLGLQQLLHVVLGPGGHSLAVAGDVFWVAEKSNDKQ